MSRREIGRAGEEFVADYLQSQGWLILDRNWWCATGELDLVARPAGAADTVVFCEVKSRRGIGFGQPIEAITTAKMAKLRELALLWLRKRQVSARHLRFDGIGVLFIPGKPPQLDHRQGIGT